MMQGKLGILLSVAAAAAGCSGDSGIAPPALSIVGVWNQGANLRDTVNHQSHIHTGAFSFAQEGTGFAGRGEQSGFCQGPHGQYTGPLADGVAYDIVDGVQQGDRVSFRSQLCTYDGTLSADQAHISGTARCAYNQAGVDFVWTGDWLANRER
jgi:hypothetical protein